MLNQVAEEVAGDVLEEYDDEGSTGEVRDRWGEVAWSGGRGAYSYISICAYYNSMAFSSLIVCATLFW